MLLRCNRFSGIQKSVVDQSGSRPPNIDHDPFWVQVWPWEVLLSFFFTQPLSCLSLVAKNPFFCHVSQSNKEMVHCCFLESEDGTSKWQFFFFFEWDNEAPTSQALPPFQLSSNAKWSQNGRHSSWAASRVAVSAPVMALNWLLPTFDGWSLYSSSSMLSSPF